MAKLTKAELKGIFDALNHAYNYDNFDTILGNDLGTYFLKLRSISRGNLLEAMAGNANIDISEVGTRNLFEYLFCENIPEKTVDDFIKEKYKEIRAERLGNEQELYTQLNKLTALDWGGFHQNQVEVTIVKDYIKKIQDYDTLSNSVENDLAARLKNYMLSSWYSNWSAILIEDMFNEHEDITPALGKVKKMDFFWNDFPFDLKVTYFPSGYMDIKRKEKGLKSELSELKRFARKNKIPFDKKADESAIYQDLVTKIPDSGKPGAKEFIETFHQHREQIIEETIAHPEQLMRWFYENQGIRRFDAANRIFVVLIDKTNLEESWKLKRNKDLLSRGITEFLDNNKDIDFKNLRLTFGWEGQQFDTHATCIFITRE